LVWIDPPTAPPPWSVIRSEFDPEARRLDIHIDFAAGSRLVCPSCGAAECPAYDTEQMTWRHLNFFEHQACLHARVPRVRCATCGIKKIGVPRARADSLPKAAVTFDKFRAVKIVSDAVDQVRRIEQKGQKVLSGTRYIWLRNPATLSERQRTLLDSLPMHHLKAGRAYQIRLAFQDLYHQSFVCSTELCATVCRNSKSHSLGSYRASTTEALKAKNNL
jgi:transposase